jgi:hypothetical protein
MPIDTGGGNPMNKNPTSSVGRSISRNLIALALSWLAAFAAVQFGVRVFGGWFASHLGQTVACLIGVLLALRLAAKFAAYLMAGMLAFSVSELLVHAYYGIRAVQGAPTHFAVMGAGVVGVVLGGLLVSKGNTIAKAGLFGERSQPAEAAEAASSTAQSSTERSIEVARA